MRVCILLFTISDNKYSDVQDTKIRRQTHIIYYTHIVALSMYYIQPPAALQLTGFINYNVTRIPWRLVKYHY